MAITGDTTGLMSLKYDGTGISCQSVTVTKLLGNHLRLYLLTLGFLVSSFNS